MNGTVLGSSRHSSGTAETARGLWLEALQGVHGVPREETRARVERAIAISGSGRRDDRRAHRVARGRSRRARSAIARARTAAATRAQAIWRTTRNSHLRSPATHRPRSRGRTQGHPGQAGYGAGVHPRAPQSTPRCRSGSIHASSPGPSAKRRSRGSDIRRSSTRRY